MVSYGEITTLDPNKGVLILIVMDNGLLPGELKLLSVEVAEGLNPYCNG